MKDKKGFLPCKSASQPDVRPKRPDRASHAHQRSHDYTNKIVAIRVSSFLWSITGVCNGLLYALCSIMNNVYEFVFVLLTDICRVRKKLHGSAVVETSLSRALTL